MRLGTAQDCAEGVHPAVEPEIAFPLLVQLDGVIVLQYAKIDVSELGAQKIKVQLLVELGPVAIALVAKVGDGIEQPAVKAAHQPDFHRVIAALGGRIVGCVFR